jgi:ATP-binding cassette subfamily F protein 3
VEWLEHALNEREGAVLIVSHDRYFLDNTVNTIWEMDRNGLEVYQGNYSAYLLQRQERWDYYQRVFKEEKERLLKEVDYVQRNWVRDSTHAQALGRLRRLTRELAIVREYGIMALRNGKKWSEFSFKYDTNKPMDVIDAIREVNAISLPSGRPPVIRPRLPETHQSGTIILRAQDLTIGYPGHPLFNVAALELRRGECAVLIGPNGAGKTTFLKALLGQVEPLKGSLQPGAGLKIGYFAQSHDGLSGEQTVLEALQSHKGMYDAEARSYLAPYLFRGEDVFKPISALSGGERARLALAILALEGSNFLLLDEPTNHLDIPAREALQEVLENFKGTILLVSHDRYLIDRPAEEMGAWDKPAHAQLEATHLDWLRTVPVTCVFRDEVFLCHATPASDEVYWLEQAMPDGTVQMAPLETIEAFANGIAQSLILCGHSHIARAARLTDGRLIVNPGSVGCPGYRDSYPPFPHVVEAGTPDARYAILERAGEAWRVTFRHVPYDHDAMAALARANGMPALASALATGWIR